MQVSAFRLSTAVDLYGLCAVYLKGRTARFSHLSQRNRTKRSSLPSRLSRESCQVHLGGCQRAECLEALGRSRQRTHAQGACPLRRRGSRIGTGEDGFRGYMDFARLARIVPVGSFFVTRAKSNLRFTRLRSLSRDCLEGVLSDQVGSPSLPKAAAEFKSYMPNKNNQLMLLDFKKLHSDHQSEDNPRDDNNCHRRKTQMILPE